MNTVYILTGSNLGDRKEILLAAKSEIGKRCGHIEAASGIYESEPWGFEAKERFLNQVVLLQTELGPYALLSKLQEIEKKMGRVRTKAGYESRLIDLDILYFNDLNIQSDTLTIPHPGIHNRAFTMVPMAELAPDLVHPILKLNQAEILSTLPDKQDIRLFSASEKDQD